MKTFIVLVAVAVCVQALTDEQIDKIKQYHKECSDESGVDPEVIAKARKGEFVDDPKLKDHLFCFSKKAGFQNDAGEIQTDVLFEKLDAELNDEAATHKLIDECAIQEDNPQDTAFDSIKCYYKKTPKHITIA